MCTSEGPLNAFPVVSDDARISVTAQYEDNIDVLDMCRFGCKYGNCPSDICTRAGSSTGGNCREGYGSGYYVDLCDFTCKLGFCPEPCVCTRFGAKVSIGITPIKTQVWNSKTDSDAQGELSIRCPVLLPLALRPPWDYAPSMVLLTTQCVCVCS
jgi:hypothetical protein